MKAIVLIVCAAFVGAVAGFCNTERTGGVNDLDKVEVMKNFRYSEFNRVPNVTYTQPTEANPGNGSWTTWTFKRVIEEGSPVIGTDPFLGTFVSYDNGGSADFDDSQLKYEASPLPKLVWEYEIGAGIPGSIFNKFTSDSLPLWLESMAFIDSHVLTQGSAAELPTITATQQAENYRSWNQARDRTVIYNSGLINRRVAGTWDRRRLADTEIGRIKDFINHSGSTNILYAFQSVLSKDDGSNAVPTTLRVQYMDELISDVAASLTASNLLDGISLEWALIDANPAQNEPYENNFRTLMATMTASNRNFGGIYFDHPCKLFNLNPSNLLNAIDFVADTLGPEYGTQLWAGWLTSAGIFVVKTPEKFRSTVLDSARILHDLGGCPNLSRIFFTDFHSMLSDEFPDEIADDGHVRQLEVLREFRDILEPPSAGVQPAGLRIALTNGAPEVRLRLPIGMPFEMVQTTSLTSGVWSAVSSLSTGALDLDGRWTNVLWSAFGEPQQFFKYRMGAP